MRQEGVDRFALMKILGHRTEAMLDRYSHADAAELGRRVIPFSDAVSRAARRTSSIGHELVTDPHGADDSNDANEKPSVKTEGSVVEPRGIEPLTSGLQSPRSPS